MTDSLATTASDDKQVEFGVVLTINGHDVPIVSKDITKIQKDGIDLMLPTEAGPIDLGTMANAAEWLSSEFGVGKIDLTGWPEPFKDIATKLLNLNFQIEALHLLIPGTNATDQTKKYTFRMNAGWADGGGIGPDAFQLTGIIFGVTNEAADSTSS